MVYTKYRSTRSFTLTLRYFSLYYKFKVVLNRQVPFPVIVSSPKQAAAVLTLEYLFPANILPSSKRSDISWSNPSFTFVYKASLPHD